MSPTTSPVGLLVQAAILYSPIASGAALPSEQSQVERRQAAVGSIAQGTAIDSCPYAATYVDSSSGFRFQICPASDYQGPSIQVLDGVESAEACVYLCDKSDMGCLRAVYDNYNQVCHLKSNTDTLTWVTSNQFTSAHRTGDDDPGVAIDSCPNPTTLSTTYDAVWETCMYSDYQGETAQMVANVFSMVDCMSLCQQADQPCVKAVYDNFYNVCHFKTMTGQLNWVSSDQYSSARKLPHAPSGTGINKCPYQTKYNVGASGATFASCLWSDYQGPSAQVIANVTSLDDCLVLCDQSTMPCNMAVYDNIYNYCHFKSNAGDLTWTTSDQFSSARRITVGEWGPVIDLPVIPVAAYVVPEFPESQRVLVFSSEQPDWFGGGVGTTAFGDYDFVTGNVSLRNVANTHHDMFCPGISALADGRVVISGGNNAEATSIYDPATNDFTRGANMTIPRGYQSSTTLSDGQVFTIGGSYSGGVGGKTGEVFDPTQDVWTLLPGADVRPMETTYDNGGDWRIDNHPWLFGWKNGSVFQAGPSRQMHWFTTMGLGSVIDAGMRDPDTSAMCGMNVMFDAVAGKILSVGGSQSYSDSDAFTKGHIITIGDVGQPATVQSISPMTYPRGFGNVVVLPDGTVVVLGGQVRSVVFTDTDGILAAELYDPSTDSWTTLASQVYARNYHSVAILLADGTVFSGGGGLCWLGGNCDPSANHQNGQILSPPYLFNLDGTPATRPVITDLSVQTAQAGDIVTVTMADDVAGCTFALVRMGSSTHSINTDQRRVPLASATQSGSAWTVTLPSDYGVLLPGHYYLFAMSANGVPSISRTLQVTLSTIPN